MYIIQLDCAGVGFLRGGAVYGEDSGRYVPEYDLSGFDPSAGKHGHPIRDQQMGQEVVYDRDERIVHLGVPRRDSGTWRAFVDGELIRVSWNVEHIAQFRGYVPLVGGAVPHGGSKRWHGHFRHVREIWVNGVAFCERSSRY